MIPKAVRLYEKKWHHIYDLFGKKKGKLLMQASLQRLKMSLYSQIRLLKKLEKASYDKELLAELGNILNQQKKLLSKAKITSIISKEYSKTVASLEDETIHLLKREQELVSRLEKEIPMARKKKIVIKLSNNQAKQAAKLISSVNKSIKNVSDAVGNRKEVQKATKILLKQLARLQHTEFYEYIRDDANNIKKAAKLIIRDPKESKVKSVLASLYLVAPFSFDATGAVIILRYAAKYANKKSKGLQRKLIAMREKRKPRLRVFE